MVVPIHDAEPFLTDCLQSLVDQDVPHEFLEVILVLDNCRDDSSHTVLRFVRRFSWMRAVEHTAPDGWAGGPRNTGVGHADGTYLYFLDADDTTTPAGLRMLLSLADTTGADVVAGGYRITSSPAPVTGAHAGVQDRLFGAVYGTDRQPFDAARKPWILARDPALAAALFRRSLVRRIAGPFVPGIPAADTVFWVRAALAAPSIAYLDRVIYHYRTGEQPAAITARRTPDVAIGLVTAYRTVVTAITGDARIDPDAGAAVVALLLRGLAGRLAQLPRPTGTEAERFHAAYASLGAAIPAELPHTELGGIDGWGASFAAPWSTGQS